MKLSVIIPAYNEEGSIEKAVLSLYRHLENETIEHELLAIYDVSTDHTEEALDRLAREIPTLRIIHNPPPRGFGIALRKGLDVFTGDAVVFYMADASDSPEDVVRFFRALETEKVDCAFGSRFMKGGEVVNYPRFKYLLNRAVNWGIQVIFGFKYNDVTNGFKLYHRRVIEGTRPFISRHFNFTVELPLKAITRGYTFCVVPNGWYGRKSGASNFKIGKLAPLYFFTILYCWAEKKILKER